MRSVNAGFGMWAVLTSVISLFVASMLAVGMTTTLDVMTAVVIGLVIWSFGYLATLTLESLAGSTMVAGLAGVAKTSAKSLQELTAKVFGGGEEKQVADNARAITEAVREELFGDEDIRKQLNGLIDRVKSGTTSRDFRNELEKLLNDVEVQSVLAGTEREKIISDVHTGSALLGRERAKNVANRLREIVTVYRQESQTAKAPSEQVADTAARAAGLNAYEAEEYRRKLEDYLRRTGREELNPEGIKRDLERLFHDPRGGAEALKNRLMAIDRNTVAAVLASRTDLNEGEARQRVDQVMGVVERITGRARQQAAEPSNRPRPRWAAPRAARPAPNRPRRDRPRRRCRRSRATWPPWMSRPRTWTRRRSAARWNCCSAIRASARKPSISGSRAWTGRRSRPWSPATATSTARMWTGWWMAS